MPRRAFSLIELLAVVAIIGILVGLLLPAVQSVRAGATRAECQNTMKQIGLALHNYESAHGRFPPDSRFPASLSWFVEMLPFIEQDTLYRTSLAAAATQADATLLPHAGFFTPNKAYACPADSRLGITHDYSGRRGAYSSYLGINSVVLPGRSRLAPGLFLRTPGLRVTEITDGTSGTVAVVERPPPGNFQAGLWYPAESYRGTSGPNTDLIIGGEARVDVGDGCGVRTPFGPGRLENPCDRLRVWSLHRSGANFLFIDGSVRFYGHGFAALLPASCTVSGGEVVPLD